MTDDLGFTIRSPGSDKTHVPKVMVLDCNESMCGKHFNKSLIVEYHAEATCKQCHKKDPRRRGRHGGRW